MLSHWGETKERNWTSYTPESFKIIWPLSSYVFNVITSGAVLITYVDHLISYPHSESKANLEKLRLRG